MYEFMDRLVTQVGAVLSGEVDGWAVHMMRFTALTRSSSAAAGYPSDPRLSGLSGKGFDAAGNYGMGISDWGWFHEIDSQNMGHMNVRPPLRSFPSTCCASQRALTSSAYLCR